MNKRKNANKKEQVMSRYLDPKADITFLKIFGEHTNLLKSFLNALLPVEQGQEIVEVEYLPLGQIPQTPLTRYSFLELKCKDITGRAFFVEIQMEFNSEFTRRLLHNVSNNYITLPDKGMHYDAIQPVYSLNLVNDIYEKGDDNYYHHYQMAEEHHPERIIEGMHLLFFELPKFKPHTVTEKKMQVLWLRFLTEINEKTKKAPAELLENAEVNKALEIVEESAYSEAEMNTYDKFWDAVSWENTIENQIKKKYQRGLEEGEAKGRAEGEAKGRAEGEAKGRAEGEAKGRAEGILNVAKNMKKKGMDPISIAEFTGLTIEEIVALE